MKSTITTTISEMQKAHKSTIKTVLKESMDTVQNAMQHSVETMQKMHQQDMETMSQIVRDMKPSITNTYNTNNTLNMQVFLNDTCKDAINIMDFARNMKLDFQDLEMIGRVGYVEGLTQIFKKQLQLLNVNQRPLHCTDAKRETLHVKHDDAWHKEEAGCPILVKAVKQVRMRNNALMYDWLDHHPGAKQPVHSGGNVAEHLHYDQIQKEVIGGKTDAIYEKNNHRIVKGICKAVALNKATLSHDALALAPAAPAPAAPAAHAPAIEVTD